jgi:hypothetical protein
VLRRIGAEVTNGAGDGDVRGCWERLVFTILVGAARVENGRGGWGRRSALALQGLVRGGLRRRRFMLGLLRWMGGNCAGENSLIEWGRWPH